MALRNLSDYTKLYHHVKNPQAAIETINDGDL